MHLPVDHEIPSLIHLVSLYLGLRVSGDMVCLDKLSAYSFSEAPKNRNKSKVFL